MINKLLIKKIFNNIFYQVIVIFVLGINIGLALFALSTSLNGINYSKDYLSKCEYYKEITYFKDIDSIYNSRKIESVYIDSCVKDTINIDCFQIGYTNKTEFLLNCEKDVLYTGSMNIGNNNAIILRSLNPTIEINDILSVEINGELYNYNVIGIIEDDSIYRKNGYPQIITYKENLSKISLKTIEVLEFEELNLIDLNNSINYKDNYDQLKIYKNALIIIGCVLVALFFFISIITFATLFKNISFQNRKTFFMLNFLGIKKKELFNGIFIICLIYNILAFVIALVVAYLLNFLIFEVVNISSLLDYSIFALKINYKSILTTLGISLLLNFLNTYISYRSVRQSGDRYV